MFSNSKKNILFLIILFFIFPQNVWAMTLSVSNLPSEINFNQEVDVTLDFSCSGCGDYSYMRGVFFPSGTNYFGLTQNNSGSWIGTSTDRSLYFAISKTDLIEASWSGKIKVKPDIEDSAYLGTGEYIFKVGRYTSANDSSADWSNELLTKIIGPTASPTQSPTNPPTVEPTQVSTIISTKSPSPIATKSPTPKPTVTSKPTAESETTDEPESDVQLIENIPAKSPQGMVAGAKTENKSKLLASLLIFSGMGFLGYVGYLLYNMRNATQKND